MSRSYRNPLTQKQSPGVASVLKLYYKRDPGTDFFCELCKIFKQTFFIKQLWWLLLSIDLYMAHSIYRSQTSETLVLNGLDH